MKRRDVIALLGAGAAAWPLRTRAQAMPVVGFLDSGTPTGMEVNLAGFRRGLAEAGYTEGKNVTVEYRWAQARRDQLPALAADLVRLNVAVIAATRSPAPALAAKGVTSTIPIVFQTGSDPVKDGLVASFNRPGGNVTGATRMTTAALPKRIGLISELVPGATTIGLLANPKGVQTADQVQEMQEVARQRGFTVHVANATNDSELDAAIEQIVKSGAAALVEASDPLFIDRRNHIVALTNARKIPTIFFERESVVEGGLMSYAANFADSFRQVGVYVGRILKGAKPADLPILQPTKFDLVINLKTAKAIGLALPPGILAIADEVIE